MTARWGLALFFGLPLLLVGVGAVIILRSRPGERVLARVPSPDGRRTAEVIEVMDEPPTVDGYLVRVGGEEAFGASGGKGMTVRWRDDRTLEADFGRARETRTGTVADLRIVPKGTVGHP